MLHVKQRSLLSTDEIVKCSKRGKVIAEPKELVRIEKSEDGFHQ